MVLHKNIPNVRQHDIKLLATDIDTDILEKARAGVYTDKVLTEIPDCYHEYLTHQPPQLHVQQSLKDMTYFKQLNLLKDWPLTAEYQIIFCRNVMIYFDKTTKEKLVNRFADQLEMGGLLYVGHSENVLHLSKRFELIGKTIYRKIA